MTTTRPRTEPGSPRPRPKQARAVETRERILAHAEIAFARHGYDAAHLTNDILEPAGVSVGSFYHQFENKREVLFDLLGGRLDEVRTAAELAAVDPAHDTFEQAFAAAVGVIVADVVRRPATWRIRYRERENVDPEIHAAIEVGWTAWSDLATTLLTRFHTADHPDFRAAVHFVVFLITGLIRDSLHPEDADPGWNVATGVDASARFGAAGVAALLDRVAQVAAVQESP